MGAAQRQRRRPRTGLADEVPRCPEAEAKYTRRIARLRERHEDGELEFNWRRYWNFPGELPPDMKARAKGVDTVGSIARADDGSFAAAVSTGGASVKLDGRVGDVPIVCAGLYAGSAGAAFPDPSSLGVIAVDGAGWAVPCNRRVSYGLARSERAAQGRSRAGWRGSCCSASLARRGARCRCPLRTRRRCGTAPCVASSGVAGLEATWAFGRIWRLAAGWAPVGFVQAGLGAVLLWREVGGGGDRERRRPPTISRSAA